MIRITVVTQTPEEVVLKVEGWIAGENVALLEVEGERYLQQAGRLVLEMEGVRFIDNTGLCLLQQWTGERLVLRGASPFVQMMLKTNGLL